MKMLIFVLSAYALIVIFGGALTRFDEQREPEHQNFAECDTVFVLDRLTEWSDGTTKLEYRVEYKPREE